MNKLRLINLQARHSEFLKKCQDNPALVNPNRDISKDTILEYLETMNGLKIELETLSPLLISKAVHTIMFDLRIKYLNDLLDEVVK